MATPPLPLICLGVQCIGSSEVGVEEAETLNLSCNVCIHSSDADQNHEANVQKLLGNQGYSKDCRYICDSL